MECCIDCRIKDACELNYPEIPDCPPCASNTAELAATVRPVGPANKQSMPCCKATFALVLEYTLGKVTKCPVCGTPV